MNKPKLERPGQITDEHLEYLDELRESGATNMMGAGSYVIAQFGVSRKEASQVLLQGQVPRIQSAEWLTQ